MTDIELLPLPEALFETRSLRDLFNVAQMQGYARANVAHATAAKDAEIEALRAEVETLRDGLDYLRQMQGAPDVLELRAKAARAERLAEALQWYAEQADGCRKIGSIGEPFRKELDRDGGKRARAALRPTAAQGDEAGEERL